MTSLAIPVKMIALALGCTLAAVIVTSAIITPGGIKVQLIGEVVEDSVEYAGSYKTAIKLYFGLSFRINGEIDTSLRAGTQIVVSSSSPLKVGDPIYMGKSVLRERKIN